MNNKDARALIKTILNLTYELNELEYKKEMSFDDFLCFLELGEPDYPTQISLPSMPKEHQLFEFRYTEKRKYSFWICFACGFVMLIAIFASLGYINQPGFIVSMIVAAFGLVGIILGLVLRFTPKVWYEINGKQCSKEDAQQEVGRLNRIEFDEYKSECARIHDVYDKKIKEYEQQLEKYNHAVENKRKEYNTFIKNAEKEYRVTKSTIDNLIAKNNLNFYSSQTLETVLQVLTDNPKKDLDESLKVADDIIYQKRMARWEVEQRELREEEEIRRHHELRELEKERQRLESELAKESVRREKDERARAEHQATVDGQRLCFACKNTKCGMKFHLKGSSCAAFRP